jgi:8-oxo-dGTP pyrophosphatase MutT (NUDIX family)
MDPGETEEECIVREMLEETNLTVQVERLIFEEPGHPDGAYKRRKTYLCRPVAGEAKPGFEPEPEAAANYSIVQVGWFDLRTMEDWDDLLRSDPFTYPQLEWLKELLGYTTASSEGQ